jgi:hypothetical protein
VAHGVRLVPVLVEDCLWDQEPLLAAVQWVGDPGRDGPLIAEDHTVRLTGRFLGCLPAVTAACCPAWLWLRSVTLETEMVRLSRSERSGRAAGAYLSWMSLVTAVTCRTARVARLRPPRRARLPRRVPRPADSFRLGSPRTQPMRKKPGGGPDRSASTSHVKSLSASALLRRSARRPHAPGRTSPGPARWSRSRRTRCAARSRVVHGVRRVGAFGPSSPSRSLSCVRDLGSLSCVVRTVRPRTRWLAAPDLTARSTVGSSMLLRTRGRDAGHAGTAGQLGQHLRVERPVMT